MAWDACFDFSQHRHRRADLAGGAIATLETIVFNKGGLHGVQLVWRAESFNGGDGVTLVHDCESQAGIDSSPASDHCACAALALIAPLFRACEVQVLAQGI